MGRLIALMFCTVRDSTIRKGEGPVCLATRISRENLIKIVNNQKW